MGMTITLPLSNLFRLNNPFVESFARQDKIYLTIHEWVISAPQQGALPSATNSLEAAPEIEISPGNIIPLPAEPNFRFRNFCDHMREYTFMLPNGYPCPLNKIKDNQFPKRVTWDVWRKGQGDMNVDDDVYLPYTPSFSGELWAQRKNSDTWGIGGKFWINPTRYCMYQDVLADTDWETSEPNMSIDDREHDGADEQVLIPDDNVIIGSSDFKNQFNHTRWSTHLEKYWQGLTSVIQGAVENTAHYSDMNFVAASENVNFHEVETYWELFDNDPLLRMNELEQIFRHISSRSETTLSRLTELPIGSQVPITFGDEVNSPCIRINLAKGVRLSIYAKTTKRIRFEVRHKFNASVRPLPSHTISSFSNFSTFLERVTADASRRLNVVAAIIREFNCVAPIGDQNEDLLWAIVKTVDNSELARLIWQELKVSGRIVNYPHSPLGSAIAKLNRQGVLQRVRRESHDQIYRPAERFLYNTRDR